MLFQKKSGRLSFRLKSCVAVSALLLSTSIANSQTVNLTAADDPYENLAGDVINSTGGNDGIKVKDLDGMSITNNGTVNADRDGIKANRADDTTITNNGTIDAGRHGIYAHSLEDITITNNGTINAAEHGMNVEVDEADITNNGTINAVDDGIFVSGDDAEIINEGDGQIVSDTDHGISVLGSDAFVVNEGIINASDDGIFVSGDDAEVINAGGEITSVNDHGISAVGSNAFVFNNGIINASDDGIFVWGDGAAIINADDGEINSENDHGISVLGRDAFVLNEGTINAYDDGIFVWGNSAEIINADGGEVTSVDDHGIDVDGNRARIVNRGSINANNNGIDVDGRGAEIVNAGSVIADKDGIHVSGFYATVINSIDGRISTEFGNGSDADGIGVNGFEAAIFNAGLIESADDGIDLGGSGGSIINVGTVIANDDGIDVEGNGNIIRNRGVVHAADNGIDIDGHVNTLINRGVVFAELSNETAAIDVEGNGNTIALLNGSLIQGRIVIETTEPQVPALAPLFDPSNTLFIGGGYDAVWTITGDMDAITIEDAGQTRFEVGNQIVTISSDNIASAQTASSQLTLDLVRSLSQTIESRQALNQICIAEGRPCQTGAWVNANAFGQDAINEQDHDRTTATLTFGYDRALGDAGSGGVYAGYANGRIYAAQSSWDNQSQTGYVGGYYNRTFGNVVTALNVLGGVSWNESSQTYLDNTVLGGIAETDTQSENYFASPSATLGYKFDLGKGTLTPSVTGRYTFVRLNGASEDAMAGVKLNNQNVHDFNARLQLAYSLSGNDEETGKSWNYRLRGGLDLYRNWGDDVGFDLDDSLVTLAGYDEQSGARPFIGVDVDFQLNDKINLDLGFEAAYEKDEAISGQGRLGLAMKF